jgi:hypothetical protein
MALQPDSQLHVTCVSTGDEKSFIISITKNRQYTRLLDKIAAQLKRPPASLKLLHADKTPVKMTDPVDETKKITVVDKSTCLVSSIILHGLTCSWHLLLADALSR